MPTLHLLNRCDSRLVKLTHLAANDDPVTRVHYGYDPHGRQGQVMDSRNGASTYGYHSSADGKKVSHF